MDTGRTTQIRGHMSLKNSRFLPGIRLALAAWFIFRQPHQDVFDEDSSVAVLLFSIN